MLDGILIIMFLLITYVCHKYQKNNPEKKENRIKCRNMNL